MTRYHGGWSYYGTGAKHWCFLSRWHHGSCCSSAADQSKTRLRREQRGLKESDAPDEPESSNSTGIGLILAGLNNGGIYTTRSRSAAFMRSTDLPENRSCTPRARLVLRAASTRAGNRAEDRPGEADFLAGRM